MFGSYNGTRHSLAKSSSVFRRCYICGKKSQKLQEEHIIPKSLYSLNPTLVLMACHDCNRNKGKLDELVSFELIFTGMNHIASYRHFLRLESLKKQEPVILNNELNAKKIQELLQKNKIKNKKLAHYYRNRFLAPLYSEAGIYLGQKYFSRRDMNALITWTNFILKGLWSLNTGKIFNWNNYTIESIPINKAQPSEILELSKTQSFEDIWRQGRYHEEWQEIFAYSGEDFGQEDISVWILEFFNNHRILAQIKKIHVK